MERCRTKGHTSGPEKMACPCGFSLHPTCRWGLAWNAAISMIARMGGSMLEPVRNVAMMCLPDSILTGKLDGERPRLTLHLGGLLGLGGSDGRKLGDKLGWDDPSPWTQDGRLRVWCDGVKVSLVM